MKCQGACLSTKEIIDIFKKYLDNTVYNYAFMLNGSWGSGKTYFVKESLIPAIQNHEFQKNKINPQYKQRQVLYISLYGIKDTEEISRLLYMQLRNDLAEKATGGLITSERTRMISSLFGTGGKIISDIIKDTKGINLEEIINKFSSGFALTDCIFIFDDLERTSCNINDVLGYINNFVEHDGIKVLLVANEKEINTASQLELKPEELSVCLQDSIDFSPWEDINKQKNQRSHTREYPHGTTKITLDQLRERASILFARNQAYKQIKEKVVGETVNYQPAYKDAVTALTNQYLITKGELREEILRKCHIIDDIAQYYKHLNLRTYLFFLSKMTALYDCLSPNYVKTLSKIIEYTFLTCVKFKSGIEFEKWEPDTLFGTKILYGELNFRNTCLAFKFIDEYITFGKFNQDEICYAVAQYESFEKKSAIDERDPARKIQNSWWTMRDQELSDCMEDVLKKMDENGYDFELYLGILSDFVNIVGVGFEEDFITRLMRSMEKNIKKAIMPVELRRTHCFFNSNEERTKYEELVEQLTGVVKKKIESAQLVELSNIYTDTENWAERIQEYISAVPNRYDAPLFQMIDAQKVIQLIDKSDSANIDSFRSTVSAFYSFSNIADFYMPDYQPLCELYNGLCPDNERYDRIKRINIEWLKRLIKDKIDKLSSDGLEHSKKEDKNATEIEISAETGNI